MNLHQFRFVREAVRQNFNLTEAAKALHTSQPGVSKAIIELEDELGIEIFARHGKRLKRITEPGQHVLKSIELILREINNLKRIGDGKAWIISTAQQARPKVIHHSEPVRAHWNSSSVEVTRKPLSLTSLLSALKKSWSGWVPTGGMVPGMGRSSSTPNRVLPSSTHRRGRAPAPL